MIPLFAVHMPPSVDKPLLEVLHSGWIGQGAKVEEFEAALKDRLGTPYVLTLNNGTAGLHLALRLSGIGPGDEVITSPMTCTATTMPILAAGARPVWVDIDVKTGNIDPRKIEAAVTGKTKAILFVHWGGYPADLDEITEIAERYGLRVIEDAAHALGATYKGRPIGCHSDFVMFSLQAIKHITTIDGGILCCKHEDGYRRGKLLRWYGIDREAGKLALRCEDDIKEYGYKFHMNDVAAVIGIEQLNHLDSILEAHRRHAAYYDAQFRARQITNVWPLRYKADRMSAYWLYTVITEKREAFIDYMRTAGIGVSRAHVRNDIHSCYADYVRPGLLNVEYFDDCQCAIPVHWKLSFQDLEYIMNKIEEFDHVLA
jgi:perosamine synthetase